MKYYFGIILLFCMVACQPSAKNDNLEMTEFTKELVYSYLNDKQSVSTINGSDEIIIVSSTDDNCFYLSIFANNPKEYTYCRDDYLGQTIFMGRTVKVFGDENNLFILLSKKVKWKKRCNPSYEEYDPTVWHICLYKNRSLCTEKTFKCSPEEDISILQSLVDKYFGISSNNSMKQQVVNSRNNVICIDELESNKVGESK